MSLKSRLQQGNLGPQHYLCLLGTLQLRVPQVRPLQGTLGPEPQLRRSSGSDSLKLPDDQAAACTLLRKPSLKGDSRQEESGGQSRRHGHPGEAADSWHATHLPSVQAHSHSPFWVESRTDQGSPQGRTPHPGAGVGQPATQMEIWAEEQTRDPGTESIPGGPTEGAGSTGPPALLKRRRSASNRSSVLWSPSWEASLPQCLHLPTFPLTSFHMTGGGSLPLLALKHLSAEA